jgi:hypothetical protein
MVTFTQTLITSSTVETKVAMEEIVAVEAEAEAAEVVEVVASNRVETTTEEVVAAATVKARQLLITSSPKTHGIVLPTTTPAVAVPAQPSPQVEVTLADTTPQATPQATRASPITTTRSSVATRAPTKSHLATSNARCKTTPSTEKAQ